MFVSRCVTTGCVSRPPPPHVAIPGYTVVAAKVPETPAPTSSAAPSAVAGTSLAASAANTSAAGTSPAPGGSQPLSSFIWFAMGMGALSLLTPCVFPMVPITVSYFSSHGSGSRRGAIIQALIYGLGIILTFSGIGVALALIFGASGVNQLAANPWVNVVITIIFIGFAFSLFGAYLIQLPTGFMNSLNNLANSQEAGGMIGALLMGLTFSLTSFTCTAPFVGTLLVTAAGGNWRWPLAGMLAYSSVFALPFFVLALAPQLVSQLPKAGGWMNSVKVVMGFLEIAAAMKFISNADLIWGWGIFTRDVVLAVWIATGLLIVLYIFGYFHFEHDTPPKFVSAWRVFAALCFPGRNYCAGARLVRSSSWRTGAVPATAVSRSAPRCWCVCRCIIAAMDSERSRSRAHRRRAAEQTHLHRLHRLHLHQLPVDGSQHLSETRGPFGTPEVRGGPPLHRRVGSRLPEAAAIPAGYVRHSRSSALRHSRRQQWQDLGNFSRLNPPPRRIRRIPAKSFYLYGCVRRTALNVIRTTILFDN